MSNPKGHTMNILRRLCVIALAAAAAAPAAAAEDMAELDKALAAVGKWTYGADIKPLRFVETTVIAAAKDPKQRDAVEQRIIRTLGAASSVDGKSFLCRQLRTIGTARSVPALEPMLADPKMTHMARYALGRIEDPAAGAALHRALGKTSGIIKAGIINTLASRRYEKALGDLVKLIGSSDTTVAAAAVEALGWLGSDEAAGALESARRTADGPRLQQINGALLKCAERLLATGNKAEAARIYRAFYSAKQPKHIRLGALRGLAMALGSEAAPLIAEAIKSDDPVLRASAIRFMTTVTGADATRAFVAMMPSLGPEGQVLVLRSLAARGDAAAAAAVTKAATSEHEAVRATALQALGAIGDVSSVPLLIKTAAAGKGEEQKMARASLQRLKGKGVDEALIKTVAAGETPIRVEAIGVLVVRQAKQAIGAMTQAAADDDADVRRAAIGALGSLGGAADLPALVALAVKPKDPADRPAIEQAIGTAFLSVPDREKRATGVLAAWPGASADVKPLLIRLLGRVATPKALAVVRGAIKDADADVQDAAVRTLAAWPDASPAAELLALARSSKKTTHKVLFLRGYVRMAGMSSNPTEMYMKAMALADRTADKKMVLAGLGTSSSAEALKLVQGYLKAPHLKAEAALAAVQIAGRLGNLDAPYAKASLKNILAVVTDADIRRKANDILNGLDKYDGYIMAWSVSGPYKGKDLFAHAFAPETGGGKGAKWQRLSKGGEVWWFDLEKMFGSMDHCAAYMRTRIFSPVDCKARLDLGSDDGIVVWVNGKKVHASNTTRGLSAAQDKVPVTLKKGWNTLMLKVVDAAGQWSFCCRIRNHEGGPLEGIKAEAQ